MKLSLSRAWDEAKAVIMNESRLLAAVALAFFVLPGVILWAVMPETKADELPPAGPWLAVLIAVLMATLVGQIAIARMAIVPHVSVGEAVARGARRLLPFLAALLMWVLPMAVLAAGLYSLAALSPESTTGVALVALVLLCLLTVFALVAVVRLILAAAVAAAEDVGPLGILKRSFHLTAGNWWRLFAFVMLYAVGAAVLLKAVEWVLGVVTNLVLGSSGVMTVGGLVVTLVVEVISSAASVTFFVVLARIYAQLAARDSIEARVPSSGT